MLPLGGPQPPAASCRLHDVGEPRRLHDLGRSAVTAPAPMVSRNAVPRRVWFFVWAGAFVAAAVIALVTPSALRQVRGGDWPMLWQSLSYAVGLVLAERFVVAA